MSKAGRTIEIKNRWNGSVLYVAKGAADVRAAVEEAAKAGADLQYADLQSADLRYANLQSADLQYADLRSADLRSADLQSADLQYADLRSADLRSADLQYANLQYADLRSAKGSNPYAVNDLLILTHQVGKIRAYKLVDASGDGPFPHQHRGGTITYEVGKTYEVKNANCNADLQCGAGINLATLPWCIQNWQEGYRILVAEFTAKDIAAIPVGDGKFRVHRCKIVRELDLAEIRLVEPKAGT